MTARRRALSGRSAVPSCGFGELWKRFGKFRFQYVRRDRAVSCEFEGLDDGRDDRAATAVPDAGRCPPVRAAATTRRRRRRPGVCAWQSVLPRGNACYTAARRFVAASLMRIKAATQPEIAAAFAGGNRPASGGAGKPSSPTRASPGCSGNAKAPNASRTLRHRRHRRRATAAGRRAARPTGGSPPSPRCLRRQRPQRTQIRRQRHLLRHRHRGARRPQRFREDSKIPEPEPSRGRDRTGARGPSRNVVSVWGRAVQVLADPV